MLKMKFLKIISSSFHARSIRENTTLTGSPLGFFAHSQNFTSEDEVINLIKFNLDYEESINPGYDRDVLIVSSNSDIFHKGEKFLKSINNKKINRGNVFTLMRENIGYSFGAYNAGFQKYQDQYDFFIFQEDDLICHQPNYLKTAVEIWKNTPNCGFVPFISSTRVSKEHRKALNISSNKIVSCHGGHGMSSRDVLKSVTQQYGNLPFNSKKDQNYIDHLRHGEIMFTYSIKSIGFEFASLPRELLLVAPAYDLMRNLKIRKNPHIHESFLYYFGQIFKRPLYQFLVKIGLKSN
jgi:hypothetical protein